MGRVPNVEELNLEKANVAFNLQEGVQTNNHLQTTNEDIYAVGDVCSEQKFTHNSDANARYVIRNALFYD